MNKKFNEHINQRLTLTAKILQSCKLPGLIIDAGEENYYFADDARIPYRPTPHFAHWCPISGSGHMIIAFDDGRKPKLLRLRYDDFWHEQNPAEADHWQDAFQVEEFPERAPIWQKIFSDCKGFGYIGPFPEKAALLGLKTTHKELLPRMDWERTQKTPYEIDCLRQASLKAAGGHKAAKTAFLEGDSEMEIFHKYLKGIGDTEVNMPYSAIIALNEKCGILHYDKKRSHVRNGLSFLIDAGAKVFGYGSDITRTYASDSPKVNPLFKELLTRMETMQRHLVAQVKEGCNFSQLHKDCVRLTGELLLDLHILKDISLEALMEKNLARKFFPHGLGHFLGIQVHDVGGRQLDPVGHQVEPDHEDPHLRTHKILRRQEVVTIEPGVYFIPNLLEPLRHGEMKHYFNWRLIDDLYPYGGIRIEDDVLVLEEGQDIL